LLYISIYF